MDDPLHPDDDDRRPFAVASAIVLLVPATAVSLLVLLQICRVVTFGLGDSVWTYYLGMIAMCATPLAFALLVLRRWVDRPANRRPR